MISRFRLSLRSIHIRHLLPDIAVMSAAIYLSLFLRLGGESDPYYYSVLLNHLPIVLAVRLLTFLVFDVYSILWRYVSISDVLKLSKAVGISTLITIAFTFFLDGQIGRLPKSVYLIDMFLVLVGLLSIRLMRRAQVESRNKRQIWQGRRTLIYGAGTNGKLLMARLHSDPSLGVNVVGFMDDDPEKLAKQVDGIRVLGGLSDLADVIERWQVTQVMVASDKMPYERLREIIDITRKFNILPRRMNSWSGKATQKETLIDRPLNLSDLLNRATNVMDLKSVRELIRGKRVLITGAGGSIGQEISRQVATFDPARLILLDHSEFSLYQIDRELRLSSTDTDKVVPLLLDLKDQVSLDNRLHEFMPEVVFHAAAYKHVHLVETNPYSAISNNVAGTLNLLNICAQINVKNFVLISSDKAVNPAGVMGATKRVCELLTTAYGKHTGNHFVSVRFGNVLGSSGSLIPLLEQQIADRGPLTITHQDMTRYFMTIPEAVSLVLKASTLATPGDISVLKMGDPVRIVDLAKALIALKGLRDDEVPIIFTGLRPGEKLYEELCLTGNELRTEHPDILILKNGDYHPDNGNLELRDLVNQVHELIEKAANGHPEAIHSLNVLVRSTYVPPETVKEESGKITFLIQGQKIYTH